MGGDVEGCGAIDPQTEGHGLGVAGAQGIEPQLSAGLEVLGRELGDGETGGYGRIDTNVFGLVGSVVLDGDA